MFLKSKLIVFMFVSVFALLFLSNVSYASMYDDFNDMAGSEALWNVYDEAEISTYNESEGVVEFDGPPISKYFTASSTYCFSGDFDVRVKYQNWSLDAVLGEFSNIPQIALQVAPVNQENNFVYILRGWVPDGGDVYFSNGRYGGPFDEGEGVSTTDVEGWVRIARTGSDFCTYYSSNGSDWNSLYIVADKFTEPILIQAGVYTGDTTNSFHAEFDYVEVTSEGAAPVPEPATLFLLGGGLPLFLIKKKKTVKI